MDLKYIVLLCCIQWGAHAFSQVTLHMDEKYGGELVSISFRDSSYSVKLDEGGVAVLHVADSLKAGYATLFAPRSIHSFYLLPGTEQSLSLWADKHSLSFEGNGKEINEYLNSDFIRTLNLPYEKDEAAFIEEWERLPQRLQDNLDSYHFPATFSEIESKRLYYLACNLLMAYPLYHTRLNKLKEYTPSDVYYRTIEKYLKEDEAANETWEYHQFYRDWIQMKANQEVLSGSELDKLRYQLNYVEQYIKDAELADYLVHNAITTHLRYVGAEGIEEYAPLYHKMVKNSVRKNEFNRMYRQYAQLLLGAKAPSFSLPDIHGENVALEQLAGNYVYIDVWASWCVPCCREFPKLKELEKRFEGKPIRFVSISIDNKIEEWKAKVEKEQLQGILLHAGPDSSFRKDYKVNLIPHFILLDKEGHFINAKMSRPSDPKTLEYLDALLNQ
ncbi:MAG: TlpA family protein disulfide reductase [Bacteroides sp.]|nr:TlpA family protein disulfide reductase [Bacteroides sp.]